MKITTPSNRFRTSHRSIYPLILGIISGVVLAACSAQTATPAAVANTLPAPSDSTATSAQPLSEISPTVETTSQSTQPALICTAPAALTPASTEGPYFTAGSPERASLVETGMPGTVLVLSGYVLTIDCQPVANAKLDFWQADANDAYDNQGYSLRGHQFTDENGFYQLTTVIPGEYPGRTEHIHFKVQAPGGAKLTSQLYFPGVIANEGDSIYKPELLINIIEEGDAVTAQFNFVIAD
jgi:protocatechuate 3,4-dioxygenase beta subunit